MTKDGRLMKDLIRLLGDSECLSILVDSNNGYIYWSEWSKAGGLGYIRRAQMNGHGTRILVHQNNMTKRPSSLSLNGEWLYWIDDEKRICSCKSNGEDARILLAFGDNSDVDLTRTIVADIYHPLFLTVTDTNIYWTDKYFPMVYRLSKKIAETISIEYGNVPRRVLDSKQITPGQMIPQHSLVVGKEIQTLLSNAFLLSLEGLQFYNKTWNLQYNEEKAFYEKGNDVTLEPLIYLAYRECFPINETGVTHVAQKYGKCSDFCFPPVAPLSSAIEANSRCDCANHLGTISYVEPNNSKPDARYYSYIFGDQRHLTTEVIGTSILLDDGLTCNGSSRCYHKGYNLHEYQRHDVNLEELGNKSTCESLGPYPGHQCRFSCLPGYSYSNGSKLRICQENDNWSGQPISCRPISCHALQTPTNSVLVSCPGTFGTNCTFKCDSRSQYITGDMTRKCSSTGVWMGTPLICLKKEPILNDGCPYPRLDLRSNAHVEKCPSNPKFGDLCELKCNDYTLKSFYGSASIICGVDGNWSQPFLKCQAIGCPSLSIPYKGQLITCDKSAPHSVNSSCYQKCQSNYYPLMGDGIRQCLSNGRWSGHELVCSKCRPLEKPSMGILNCGLKGKTVVCATVCDKGAVQLDSFVSDHHYMSDAGASEYLCDETSGQWYPHSNPPSCIVLVPPIMTSVFGTLAIYKSFKFSTMDKDQSSQAFPLIRNINDLKNFCKDKFSDLSNLIGLLNPLKNINESTLSKKCTKLQEFSCSIELMKITKIDCDTGPNLTVTLKTINQNYDDTNVGKLNEDTDFEVDYDSFSMKNSPKQASEMRSVRSNLIIFYYDFLLVVKKKQFKNKIKDASLINEFQVSDKDKHRSISQNSELLNLRVDEVKVDHVCNEGHIIVGESCAACPDGTMKSSENCIPCPARTYQDEYAQTTCKKCQTAQLIGSRHCRTTLSNHINQLTISEKWDVQKHSMIAMFIGTNSNTKIENLFILLATIILVSVIGSIMYIWLKRRNQQHPYIIKIPLPFKFLNRNFLDDNKEHRINVINNEVVNNGLNAAVNEYALQDKISDETEENRHKESRKYQIFK